MTLDNAHVHHQYRDVEQLLRRLNQQERTITELRNDMTTKADEAAANLLRARRAEAQLAACRQARVTGLDLPRERRLAV